MTRMQTLQGISTRLDNKLENGQYSWAVLQVGQVACDNGCDLLTPGATERGTGRGPGVPLPHRRSIFQRCNITWIEPEFVSFEQTAHDLTAARFGQFVHKIDLAGLRNWAKIATYMTAQGVHHLG